MNLNWSKIYEKAARSGYGSIRPPEQTKKPYWYELGYQPEPTDMVIVSESDATPVSNFKKGRKPAVKKDANTKPKKDSKKSGKNPSNSSGFCVPDPPPPKPPPKKTSKTTQKKTAHAPSTLSQADRDDSMVRDIFSGGTSKRQDRAGGGDWNLLHLMDGEALAFRGTSSGATPKVKKATNVAPVSYSDDESPAVKRRADGRKRRTMVLDETDDFMSTEIDDESNFSSEEDSPVRPKKQKQGRGADSPVFAMQKHTTNEHIAGRYESSKRDVARATDRRERGMSEDRKSVDSLMSEVVIKRNVPPSRGNINFSQKPAQLRHSNVPGFIPHAAFQPPEMSAPPKQKYSNMEPLGNFSNFVLPVQREVEQTKTQKAPSTSHQPKHNELRVELHDLLDETGQVWRHPTPSHKQAPTKRPANFTGGVSELDRAAADEEISRKPSKSTLNTLKSMVHPSHPSHKTSEGTNKPSHKSTHSNAKSTEAVAASRVPDFAEPRRPEPLRPSQGPAAISERARSQPVRDSVDSMMSEAIIRPTVSLAARKATFNTAAQSSKGVSRVQEVAGKPEPKKRREEEGRITKETGKDRAVHITDFSDESEDSESESPLVRRPAQQIQRRRPVINDIDSSESRVDLEESVAAHAHSKPSRIPATKRRRGRLDSSSESEAAVQTESSADEAPDSGDEWQECSSISDSHPSGARHDAVRRDGVTGKNKEKVAKGKKIDTRISGRSGCAMTKPTKTLSSDTRGAEKNVNESTKSAAKATTYDLMASKNGTKAGKQSHANLKKIETSSRSSKHVTNISHAKFTGRTGLNSFLQTSIYQPGGGSKVPGHVPLNATDSLDVSKFVTNSSRSALNSFLQISKMGTFGRNFKTNFGNSALCSTRLESSRIAGGANRGPQHSFTRPNQSGKISANARVDALKETVGDLGTIREQFDATVDSSKNNRDASMIRKRAATDIPPCDKENNPEPLVNIFGEVLGKPQIAKNDMLDGALKEKSTKPMDKEASTILKKKMTDSDLCANYHIQEACINLGKKVSVLSHVTKDIRDNNSEKDRTGMEIDAAVGSPGAEKIAKVSKAKQRSKNATDQADFQKSVMENNSSSMAAKRQHPSKTSSEFADPVDEDSDQGGELVMEYSVLMPPPPLPLVKKSSRINSVSSQSSSVDNSVLVPPHPPPPIAKGSGKIKSKTTKPTPVNKTATKVGTTTDTTVIGLPEELQMESSMLMPPPPPPPPHPPLVKKRSKVTKASSKSSKPASEDRDAVEAPNVENENSLLMRPPSQPPPIVKGSGKVKRKIVKPATVNETATKAGTTEDTSVMSPPEELQMGSSSLMPPPPPPPPMVKKPSKITKPSSKSSRPVSEDRGAVEAQNVENENSLLMPPPSSPPPIAKSSGKANRISAKVTKSVTAKKSGRKARNAANTLLMDVPAVTEKSTKAAEKKSSKDEPTLCELASEEVDERNLLVDNVAEPSPTGSAAKELVKTSTRATGQCTASTLDSMRSTEELVPRNTEPAGTKRAEEGGSLSSKTEGDQQEPILIDDSVLMPPPRSSKRIAKNVKAAPKSAVGDCKASAALAAEHTETDAGAPVKRGQKRKQAVDNVDDAAETGKPCARPGRRGKTPMPEADHAKSSGVSRGAATAAPSGSADNQLDVSRGAATAAPSGSADKRLDVSRGAATAAPSGSADGRLDVSVVRRSARIRQQPTGGARTRPSRLPDLNGSVYCAAERAPPASGRTPQPDHSLLPRGGRAGRKAAAKTAVLATIVEPSEPGDASHPPSVAPPKGKRGAKKVADFRMPAPVVEDGSSNSASQPPTPPPTALAAANPAQVHSALIADAATAPENGANRTITPGKSGSKRAPVSGTSAEPAHQAEGTGQGVGERVKTRRAAKAAKVGETASLAAMPPSKPMTTCSAPTSSVRPDSSLKTSTACTSAAPAGAGRAPPQPPPSARAAAAAAAEPAVPLTAASGALVSSPAQLPVSTAPAEPARTSTSPSSLMKSAVSNLTTMLMASMQQYQASAPPPAAAVAVNHATGRQWRCSDVSGTGAPAHEWTTLHQSHFEQSLLLRLAGSGRLQVDPGYVHLSGFVIAGRGDLCVGNSHHELKTHSSFTVAPVVRYNITNLYEEELLIHMVRRRVLPMEVPLSALDASAGPAFPQLR